jgi:hypothetical protein
MLSPHILPSPSLLPALLTNYLQVPILSLDSPFLGLLPAPLQVGNIYQNFSDPDTGIVQNIIEFGVWPWTREQDGITFTVEARWGRQPGQGKGGNGRGSTGTPFTKH